MLTIVIPTRNRPPFLARLLNYYESAMCPYPILIGDSSDDYFCKNIEDIVKRFSSKLNLKLRKFHHNNAYGPGQGTIECMSHLLEEVQTQYVAFNADDDFLVVNTLKKCVDFLEMHPDYSVVHGEAVLFTLKQGQVFGSIEAISHYPQRTLEHCSVVERFLENLMNFSTTEFSVKRTYVMKETWKTLYQMQLDNYFGELLVSSLSIIDGKIKKLDDLYMIRQAHLYAVGSMRDLYDWIADPNFADQYKKFSDCLTQALVEHAQIDLEKALEFVKQAFWCWLSQALMIKWNRCYKNDNSSFKYRLKKFIKKSPHFLRFVKKVQSLSSLREPTLEGFLRPSFHYHGDFMPVYKAITNQIHF